MRLLLTSAGIANTSIHDALLGLLGKPIEESSALVTPTAIYPFPGGARSMALITTPFQIRPSPSAVTAPSPARLSRR